MSYNIIASAGTLDTATDSYKGLDKTLQNATGNKGNISYINGPGSDGNLLNAVTGNIKQQADIIYNNAAKTLSTNSDTPLVLLGHSRSGESTRIAAGMLEKKYPDANVKVVLLDPVRGALSGLSTDHYESPSKYPTTILWSKKNNSPLYSRSDIKDSPNIKQVSYDIDHSDALPGNAKGNKDAQQALYNQLVEDIQGKKDMPIAPIAPQQAAIAPASSNVPEGFDPAIWNEVNKTAPATPAAASSNVPEGFDPAIWNEVNKTAPSTPAPAVDMIKTEPDESFLKSAGNFINDSAQSVNNSFEQLGRGLLKGEYEIGAALGMDNETEINNINKLSQAAAQKQAQIQQRSPVASFIGEGLAGAAQSAPLMMATGGLSGLGLAKNIAQGAGVEGALGYGKDTSDNRLASGALGAAGGAAGGVLGSALGYGVSKIANKIGGVLSEPAQKAADLAQITGTKPTVLEVAPLWARKAFEWTGDLPLAGTQKAADKIIGNVQKDVTNQLTKNAEAFHQDFGDDLTSLMQKAADRTGGNNFQAAALMKDISKDNDWTRQISDSGKLTQYANQHAYNVEKDALLAKAGITHPIEVKDLQASVKSAIDSAVNPATGKVTAAYTPKVLTLLNKLNDDLGVLGKEGGKITAADLDKQQGVISGLLNKMYKANQVFGDADANLINGLKKDFDDVLLNTLDKSSPQLASQLRDLKSTKFKQLEAYKMPIFARLINDSTTPDEAAESAFNAALKGKNTAKIFFDALDPVGRNAVKYGFAKKLYSGITNAEEQFGGDANKQIAAMTAPAMRKMLADNKDFMHTFFSPEEITHINGSLKVAHYLDNYAPLFSHAPTGRINTVGSKVQNAVTASIASGGTAALPIGAGFTGMTLFNKLMNKELGPWISAASSIKPTSPAFGSLMDKIVRTAAVGTAGNQ